jgi:hypothetical protein
VLVQREKSRMVERIVDDDFDKLKTGTRAVLTHVLKKREFKNENERHESIMASQGPYLFPVRR